MKKIIIISFATIFCLHSNAQNVGIGIATPKAMLHIKGNADTSQLVIDANVTQSNIRPLIRLRNAAGIDLLHIHSDNINNTFVGLNAGKVNNFVGGGIYNSFLGSNAGYSNTVGSYNTAIGHAALYLNTAGQYNTAVGSQSLYSNKAEGNTANGYQALYSNNSGTYNVANGVQALYSNTRGFSNTANGYQALYSNTSGSTNTANGYKALFYNNGGDNTAYGFNALYNNTTASQNVAIGSESLNNQSFSNGGVAWNCNNVAVGYRALFFNNPTGITNGVNNTAIGASALLFNSNGANNTAIGTNALYNNQYGFYNTAIGKDALITNTDASYNTATGYQALFNNNGSYNTASGYQALYQNATGTDNVAIGQFALFNNVGGSNNIAIGNSSGTYYTYPNINNSIGIGNYGIQIGTNNQTVIGNFSSTGYLSHNPWGTFSDARIKTDIKEEVKGLDFITRLRPVTYHKSIKAMVAVTGSKETKDFPGKYDVEKIKFSGFLAQEVEKAANESGYDFSGLHKPNNSREMYALSYETFVVPLVKAVQEQQQTIEQLREEVKQLSLKLNALIIRTNP